MIPMFITALQAFSQEINIENCGLRFQGTNVKVAVVKRDDLTLTGFMSPRTNSDLAGEAFNRILNLLHRDYAKAIEDFRRSGNSSLFDPFVPVMIETMGAIDW
jgi:hypothetical protein